MISQGDSRPTRTLQPASGPGDPVIVIELVGPAGAGKTTLAGALHGADPARGLGRLRLVGGLVPEMSMLAAARLSAPGRNWSRDELRSLAYLTAWQSRVQSRRSTGLLVFDHGPVFRLTSLAAFGPPMTRTPAFSRHWRSLARDWGQLLEVVVWLDAPDDVLLCRIDRRRQEHRIRGIDRGEAEAFLARFRQAYHRTITAVTSAGARLVELDTTAGTPERLAAAVRAAVRSLPDRGST